MTENPCSPVGVGYKDHKVRQDHAVTRQMIVDHVIVCKEAGLRNDRAHRWMLGMITTVLLMLGGYGLGLLASGYHP